MVVDDEEQREAVDNGPSNDVLSCLSIDSLEELPSTAEEAMYLSILTSNLQ